MLYRFHNTKLKFLYMTLRPMFFAGVDKTKKLKLNSNFEKAYNNHEAHFICFITNFANVWIRLPASNICSIRLAD